MMGIEFAGDVPFDDVYITSIIQAPDGRRMSKCLGTGIDPLDEIDAPWRRRGPLRAAGDVLDPGRALLGGQDPAGQDLANKLWNASRLILLNASTEALEGQPPAERGPARSGSRTAGSSPGFSGRSRP